MPQRHRGHREKAAKIEIKSAKNKKALFERINGMKPLLLYFVPLVNSVNIWDVEQPLTKGRMIGVSAFSV